MLDGRYVDDRINAYYATPPDRQDMNMHVSFGVARDMSSEPHALTMFLKEPVTLLGKERDRISVEIYSFDPSMAPAGQNGAQGAAGRPLQPLERAATRTARDTTRPSKRWPTRSSTCWNSASQASGSRSR